MAGEGAILPPKKPLPTVAPLKIDESVAKEHGNTTFGVAQQHYGESWERDRQSKPLDTWSVDLVADWLHRVRRLPGYVSPFLDAEIDGAALVALMAKTEENEAEWLKLGVSATHRLQISKAVRNHGVSVSGEGATDGEISGFGKLMAMWEKGYVPEVDEDASEEEVCTPLLAHMHSSRARGIACCT